MLFIILGLLLMILGIILHGYTHENVYLVMGLLAGFFVMFAGYLFFEYCSPLYDTPETEYEYQLTTFLDSVYYKNNSIENNIDLCIINNDKVSHIETIHYKNLKIEYVKDISSATATVKTYKLKPEYKLIMLNIKSEQGLADVILHLPESAKNK